MSRASLSCDLDEFRQLVEVDVEMSDYPRARGLASGAIEYAGDCFDATDEGELEALRVELAAALLDGPGIVVIRGAFDRDVVDRVSEVFTEIIREQRTSGAAAGDHFATAGANDRIWNSLEKLALRDPAAFVAYHDNPAIDITSLAWLGPSYQLTAQVNVVNPGGAAQSAHRDYHLGFMSRDVAASYPRHAHRLSPVLTLQGAVAHSEMRADTGPTMYLPHSQKYEAGYLAWHRPEFQDYFDQRRSQPELGLGDAVFFNPALFHAAGANRTSDVHRMANLLQVSSAFGRAMESVDRRAMVEALYPVLLAQRDAGRTDAGLRRVVAASAEGYAFPADLDHDQPVEGMTPDSMADIVWSCLLGGASAAGLASALDERFGAR